MMQQKQEFSVKAADLPPFPQDVSSHPLLVLDLNALKAGDPAELDKLWNACTSLGFFYLKGFDTSLSDNVFDLTENTLKLPVEEKQAYDQGSLNSYFGYKGVGETVIDQKGTTDLNEYYNIAKDDIVSYPIITHRENHPMIQKDIPELRKFVDQSYDIVKVVLQVLESKLELNNDELLDMHKFDDISGDQVRYLKVPPRLNKLSEEQASLGAHTDFGSVTVLYNRLGGLQVLVPGTTDWQYIKPLPGHAIINLGDSLSVLTCGALRSNMHRVVEPPGDQAKYTRYSCVYFNRPSDATVLKPLKGSKIVQEAAEKNEKDLNENFGTVEDWIARRVKNRRKEHYKGPQTYFNSRGTEHRDNPGIKADSAGASVSVY